MSRRWLIVNADDLGHSPGTDRGIFEAHLRGIVSSTTLMVNRSWASEAASRLAEVPELGVGLHVQLTGASPGARPTSPSADVPSLTDDRGWLPAKPEGLAGAKADEVETEVLAQLELFRRLTGRTPTHLDSHHHAHREPPVLEAFVRVARRTGLPVRRAGEAVAERLVLAGVSTTDGFNDAFYGPNVEVADLLQVLGDLGAGSQEVMCHPGRVDPVLADSSSYVEDRERELATLCAPEVLQAIDALDFDLVHYGLLAPRPA